MSEPRLKKAVTVDLFNGDPGKGHDGVLFVVRRGKGYYPGEGVYDTPRDALIAAAQSIEELEERGEGTD